MKLSRSVVAAFMVTQMVFFAGCKAKDAEDLLQCDLSRISNHSQERREVTRFFLVLERAQGQWKPQRILTAKKWEDRRDHFSASGRVEVYSHAGRTPFASVAAEGPGRLELEIRQGLDQLNPSQRDTVERLLDGATFTLPLPEGVTMESARIVKWVAQDEVLNASVQDREPIESLTFETAGLPIEEISPSPELRGLPGLQSKLPSESIHWSGNPRSRLNLLILPDGYTAAQMPEFRKKASELVGNLLGSQRPYSDYAEMINVVRVDAPSSQSGADCDDLMYTLRNNRYGSSFPLACMNALLGTKFNDRFIYQLNFARVLQDANSVYYNGVSLADEVYVLVRSPKYGGASIIWANQTDTSGWDVAAHEMGHAWGGLADEYYAEGDVCNVFMLTAPNLSTKKNKPSLVKWKQWILSDTPIPTAKVPEYADRVGLYQGGGGGCKTVAYHPQQACKMEVSREKFCSVCMEQMVLRIYDRINPIQGMIQRQDSTVDVPVSLGEKLRTVWMVDGKVVQDTPTYQPFTQLAAGAHSVRVGVQEQGAPVRRDRCSLVFTKDARL